MDTSSDMLKLNELGYRPSREEISNPGKNWKSIQRMNKKYNFEGDYKCKLCPKKILATKLDLTEHLGSKVRLLYVH